MYIYWAIEEILKKNINIWRLKNIKMDTFPVYSTRYKKLKKKHMVIKFILISI